MAIPSPGTSGLRFDPVTAGRPHGGHSSDTVPVSCAKPFTPWRKDRKAIRHKYRGRGRGGFTGWILPYTGNGYLGQPFGCGCIQFHSSGFSYIYLSRYGESGKPQGRHARSLGRRQLRSSGWSFNRPACGGRSCERANTVVGANHICRLRILRHVLRGYLDEASRTPDRPYNLFVHHRRIHLHTGACRGKHRIRVDIGQEQGSFQAPSDYADDGGHTIGAPESIPGGRTVFLRQTHLFLQGELPSPDDCAIFNPLWDPCDPDLLPRGRLPHRKQALHPVI